MRPLFPMTFPTSLGATPTSKIVPLSAVTDVTLTSSDLPGHQIVPSKGTNVAGRCRGMMSFWVLTQKLYRIANQLLKVVVAKPGPTM
jgi:hypothetical protein